jgi:ATP adenylyltransferase
MEFVAGGRKDTCIFCSKPKDNDDRKNHIFARGKYVFGMLNTFPYNSGHLMISPYRHITEIGAMEGEEWLESLQLLKESISAIEGLMEPQGFNIGVNLGAAAGGGFDHIHIHAVPRWRGDTNFMPVLAETKVLPEHIDSTYDRLVEAMKRVRDEREEKK